MKAPRRRFSPSVYRAILVKQGYRCACVCRGTLENEKPGDIQFDHILPLHLGGEDEPENLQALKRGHHATKTAKEAAARGKVHRIIAQDGLKRKKLSERDKVMAKALAQEN